MPGRQKSPFSIHYFSNHLHIHCPDDPGDKSQRVNNLCFETGTLPPPLPPPLPPIQMSKYV